MNSGGLYGPMGSFRMSFQSSHVFSISNWSMSRWASSMLSKGFSSVSRPDASQLKERGGRQTAHHDGQAQGEEQTLCERPWPRLRGS